MITHHRQSFFETADELLSVERIRLSALIGQRITTAWIAIDESDGSWFNDEPAVICLGSIQLEIAVYQTGLMALTWNTIDLSGRANWLGIWDWDDDRHYWHPASEHPFSSAMGQRIQEIHIVDGQDGVDAIQFKHEAGVLALFNAGDELDVCHHAFDTERYSLHAVVT